MNLFKRIICLVFLFATVSAEAIVISANPISSSITPNSSVDVQINISGLGSGIGPSVSAYDIDFSFDDSIFQLGGVTFGDSILGNQLDLFGFGSLSSATNISAGLVNLFELSFDLAPDLDLLQAGSFTLATLTFNAIGIGNGLFGLSINALGDSSGNPLQATTVGTGIQVAANSVPEPETTFLILPFLLLLVFRIYKEK